MAHHTRSLIACCLLGGCLLSGSLHAALPVVEMTSLEWPPYTGETIAEHGIIGKYAVDAFARMGYQLKISYLPWRRAVRYVEESSRYVGFLPEYSTPERERQRQRQFHCSEPMRSVPLALLHGASFAHHDWQQLSELSAYRIGTVTGYLNTPEFDALVAKGVLHIEEAPSDLLNIRKVAAGRLPLAVVDPLVLDYYLKQDPILKAQSSSLHLPVRLIGGMKLVACFKRTAEGKRWRDIFNLGLYQLQHGKLP